MKNIRTSLNFSVDRVEFEDVKNSRFKGGTIYAFADGPNAHTLPISNEVLQKCANTVYDIPVVCQYSEYVDDFLSHEEDEVPIGFIKEGTDTYENPIVFKKMEDGRTFIVIKALIWQRYSKSAVEVLERKDKKKSVSVEITITNGEEVDGKVKVNEFVLEGITILGDFVTPAVKGAHIQMEFSKDKKNYLSELKFADKKIIIDNSKESSISGAWSNPRRKLFDPISNASNKVSLIKEAYLVNDGSDTEPEISKLKYPHHVIRSGKLVLQKDGVEAAFQRASQQGIVKGNVKSHLLRHYKELGLTTENFATFGLTEKQFNLYFSELTNEECAGDKKVENDNKEEFSCVVSEETSEVAKTEEEMSSECETEISEEAKECPEEETPEEKMAEESKTEESEESTEKMSEEETEEEVSDEHDDSEEEMSVDKCMAQIAKMGEKINSLEESNKAYMAKISEMSDYEDLKKYKAENEEQKRREEEMAEMKSVMADVESNGVTMSDEEKEDLMAKFSEFDSKDAWANYVKATAFEMSKGSVNTVIGLPYSQPKSTGSIWDRI